MRRHKIQARSSEVEVINIGALYEKFEHEKRRYAPSLFCVGEKTKRKRPKPVSLSLYKKIVLEYLKLYFWDFYMKPFPIYFPLGGFMKKVTYPKWVRFMAKGKSEKRISGGNNALGLFWFVRPSMKMYYLVSIKKLTGSSNRIPDIEKVYVNNFNKDLLPIFNQELRKAKDNKTLYLCTLT